MLAYCIMVSDLRERQVKVVLYVKEKGKITNSEYQKNLLLEVTAFNIKARYPDYKYKFYKKATKSFTDSYLEKTKKCKSDKKT